MPWYKAYADFGPGHQSHDTYYYWRNYKISKDEKDEIWHDYFDNKEYAIGDTTCVRHPPLDEMKRMLMSHTHKMEYHKYMIDILKKQILPVSAKEIEKDAKELRKMNKRNKK